LRFEITIYLSRMNFRMTTMVRQKQILGILGIICAILGGVIWIYHQYLPAFFLWGIAGLILIKLNKKGKRSSR
jgi:hypothetical protein